MSEDRGFAGLSALGTRVDFAALEIESRAKEAPAGDPQVRALRFASFEKPLFTGWSKTLRAVVIMLLVPPAGGICAWILASLFYGDSPNRNESAAPAPVACANAGRDASAVDQTPCNESRGHPGK
jgi:hypothetical protein